MKKLIIFLFGVFIVSCIQRDSRNPNTIPIPKNIEKDMVLNDLFNDFEFIPLETTEQSLFGYVNKIEFLNNKFYILDKIKTKRINVFHSDGKFSHSIGKVGNGTGGFLFSTDYQSTENNYLIYRYDKDFILTDKIIKSNNTTVKMPPLNIDPFIKDGDKISYFDFFNSTLYWDILNANTKQITFEFGNKKAPIEIFNSPMQFFEKQQNYNFFITAVIDKGLFWSSYSNHGQGAVMLITDLAAGEKIAFNKSWFVDILCCHDGYFYKAYSPMEFQEKNFNFEAKVKSNFPVDFDSNPVILRFKAQNKFKY